MTKRCLPNVKKKNSLPNFEIEFVFERNFQLVFDNFDFKNLYTFLTYKINFEDHYKKRPPVQIPNKIKSQNYLTVICQSSLYEKEGPGGYWREVILRELMNINTDFEGNAQIQRKC